jgi:hypothetical protein
MPLTTMLCSVSAESWAACRHELGASILNNLHVPLEASVASWPPDGQRLLDRLSR